MLAVGLVAGGLITFNVRAVGISSDSGHGGVRGHFLERAKTKLGLTAEQSAQIKAVLGADRELLRHLISQRHAARIGLRAAIQADGATEAAVRVAAAKVAAVEADLAVERLKLYGKLAPILTADQRAQVKEFQRRLDEVLDGAIDRLGERWAE